MQIKYVALAVMAGATLSGQTFSQEVLPALDEIVITSSRVALPLRQIGTSVSVLSAEDIEAHGNLSLATILRQLPGVNTSSNGGAGSITTLRVRGEEGFRTLSIIDGIRISDPSGPQIGTQMEHLLSSGVGRVELLRGPQGLAYGADAGGVINISSPRVNEGLGFNLDAQSGAFDTQQYNASVSAANDQADIFVLGSDLSTEGFNSRDSDTVLQDKDGYENQTIHARLGWNASEALRLEIAHRNIESDSEFDGCFDSLTFSTVHDCSGNYGLSATRLAMDYQSDSMGHSLSYASAKTDRENFVMGTSSFIAEGELNRWEYLGTVETLPKAKLVFGLDHEQASNNGAERINKGVHLEYLSDFSDALFVTAGIRYDDNDDFGQHTSYRFSSAYLYELANEGTLKFRGSIGTGFRAPSPFESAFNSGAFAYPPASLISLKEETSKGYEAGVEYFNESVHFQMVYFDQEVEDAIRFDLVGFSGYLQENGKNYSEGLELSGNIEVSQSLALLANYTFNETETADGLWGIRRPKHFANLGINYTNNDQGLNLNAFYRYSSKAEDEVFGSRVTLESFGVLDLSASYLLGNNITLFGRIENLTNKNYRELVGFNTADRAAYLGFKYRYH